LGEVDAAHAARAELLDDAVVAERLADRDRHDGASSVSSRRMRAFVCVLLAACGSGATSPAAPDAPVRVPDAGAPVLSNPGLSASFGAGTIAPRLRAYEPRYALWADGLAKRRWLDLPAGQKVDTSGVDH